MLELLNQSFDDFLASLLSGPLSEEKLEFCNHIYGVTFPCTYLADFLRDTCDVCPREVSDKLPCTARFVRCGGRWIFSLRDWEDPDVRVENLARVQLAVTLGIDVLCNINPLQSSCFPLSQYKCQEVC